MILRAAFRRPGMLLACCGAGALAGGVVLALQTPVYRAQAVVKIDPRPVLADLGGEGPSVDADALVDTEVQGVTSLEVCRRAGLLMASISPGAPEEEARRQAEDLKARVKAKRLGGSALIRVSAEDPFPDRAAALANAVVQAYIQKGVEDRALKARETRNFTEQEALKAGEKLREAEAAHKALAAEADPSQTLAALEEKLARLKKVYTDRHPDVIALRARIREAQENRRRSDEKKEERHRLARELRLSEEGYAFLSRKLKEAHIAEAKRDQLAFEESRAAAPQRPVRPDARALLPGGAAAGLLLALLATLLAEGRGTSPAEVEEAERSVGLPVLAVIPRLRVPGLMLTFLSRAAALEEMRRRLAIFHPGPSPFAEAYHTLRSRLNLPLGAGGRSGQAVLFTSAATGEGKTLTAMNVAMTAAQSGLRTLFIEADFRRPLAHRLLGMPPEPGLADALLGQRPWSASVRGTTDFLFGELRMEQILRSPGIENFRLLPCGPPLLNPAEALGSLHFERVLREARQAFDLVVIDSPAAGPFADAVVMAAKADGVVLIHRPGAAFRADLRHAKEQLLNTRGKLLGVVLNG